ncbi:MAG: phospholipid carrier-dependent glycosyltransferase [Anaerolineae bacterium]|nr:phospholipid carrier-dependent glycosyltransferase [Anaerolineae bacterium]
MHTSDFTLAAFLALLLFGIYMFTFDGTLHSTDGLSMLAVAENMVKHGRFDTRQLENWENVFLGINNQPFSKYPIGPTLLMLPFVALALVIPQLGLIQTTLVLMPLATALTAPYVYLSARRLGYAPKTGMVLTLLAGLATMAWPRTRDLVADPLILWSFTAAFYYALAYRQQGRRRHPTLLGLTLSLAVLHKVTNLVVVPFFFWYMAAPAGRLFDLKSLKKHKPALAIAGAAWASCLLIIGGYNLVRFNSLVETGYERLFTTPLWLGFSGFLISPYKSIFLYTPLLILIPFSLKPAWQRHRHEVVFILALLLSQMLLFGAWHDWGGGESWGPRFLMPLHSLLLLLLLPFIERALQPGQWRWQMGLIFFSGLSLWLQLLAISARDYVYLDAENYWSPPPSPSLWGELSWTRPDQWPIWGHWLRFEVDNIPVIWRWQWGEISHFDGLTLLAALFIVTLALVGIALSSGGQAAAKLFAFQKPVLGSVWLVALGCVAVMLVRSYHDPHSIEEPEETDEYWPAYSALLADLPQLATKRDAVIFTDSRYDFYLFNADKSFTQRFMVANPKQTQLLEAIPHLIQAQASTSRIWLVTDPLDNGQLAYATEIWLRAHSHPKNTYIFGNSVRLTAFEPLQPVSHWTAIPAKPPMTALLEPDKYEFEDIAGLLGWNWSSLDPAKSSVLETGQTYPFELYWIYQGKAPQDTFFARLLDPTGQTALQVLLPSDTDHHLTLGQLMIEQTKISIPAKLAPGLYQLQLGFSTSAVAGGELTFDPPTELTEIRIINGRG